MRVAKSYSHQSPFGLFYQIFDYRSVEVDTAYLFHYQSTNQHLQRQSSCQYQQYGNVIAPAYPH